MQVKIEQYDIQYKEQLRQLLRETDEVLLNRFESNQVEHVFVAISKSELVGALLTWKNSFHPFCLYFRIITIPSFVEHEIFESLIDYVEKDKPTILPLITSLWEESDSLLQFYLQQGFKIIRKTFIPTLKVKEYTDVILEPNEMLDLMTVGEISDDDKLVMNLVQMVKRNYEQSHKANPVASLSLNQWRELIFSDDLIPEGSYLYVKDNQIIAYTFLHETSNHEVEMGWVGAEDLRQKEKVASLVHRQIDFAERKGFEFLSGEFDTTDKFAIALLESLQLPRTPVWITLKKH